MDWRDAAAYAPLLAADRSLLAWEWLRRDEAYRCAARSCGPGGGDGRAADSAAAPFGLVAFEPPDRAVPNGRPLWRAAVHPLVLVARRGSSELADDRFALNRLSAVATLRSTHRGEHLLLSDGLQAIRLDGPIGLFSERPRPLAYAIEGLPSAEPPLLALQQLLGLCRNGRFSRSLHRPESRRRRWILLLRARDALASGASQREIAEALLSRSAADCRWRIREPSVRSQAQRLVRAARGMAAGGYRALLR